MLLAAHFQLARNAVLALWEDFFDIALEHKEMPIKRNICLQSTSLYKSTIFAYMRHAEQMAKEVLGSQRFDDRQTRRQIFVRDTDAARGFLGNGLKEISAPSHSAGDVKSHFNMRRTLVDATTIATT